MDCEQGDVPAHLNAVPTCKACGSARVAKDAYAHWDPDWRAWVLETILDKAHCHQCEGETTLVWKQDETLLPSAVRELNDRFRTEGLGSGTVVVTRGVQALGAAFVKRAFQAVRTFSEFSADNDPWGEHDFGAVEIDEEKVFWKIDYYDLTMTAASPDPANDDLTCRVLTIMLANEY